MLKKSEKEGLSFSSRQDEKAVLGRFLENGLNKFWTTKL